jgi:NADPH2:quinone reductase
VPLSFILWRMQAILVSATGGPETLAFTDVPDPIPSAGQALVRIEAAGINFIDVYHCSGLYSIQLPAVLGSEGAGTVTATGPGVSTVRPGDRVAYQGVLGAYAQLAAVPADRLIPVPDGVTTRDAAAVLLQGMTAHYLALSTFPLSARDTCLVHAAAGGVGLLLVQIAKMRGARVIGTVSTEAKARLAREAGADEIILYTSQDFVAETKRMTQDRGVQVVYDSVGRTTFEGSLSVLAPRGMMVLFGQSSGPVPPVDPQILARRGSLFLTRPTLGAYVTTREDLLARARDLFTWIAEGKLHVRIDHVYPLAKAADAHRALIGRQTTGKLLLVP